jgi:DNA-binding NtrC family response regulator
VAENKGRVLVVAEDRNLRESLADILDGECLVTLVDSYEAAGKALAQSTYDVVVSDHSFNKGGSGAELLEGVAKRDPASSGILLTGSMESVRVRRVVDQTMDTGRTLVLYKPVDPDELLEWVRNGVAMAAMARLRAASRQKK